MESSTELVIKVNYRSVLRRFRVLVNANSQLDLDMARLREKIIALFNLPVNAQLTLTYTDEDGDVVALVEDSDLHDVVNQYLKFVKINVQLNTGPLASSNAAMPGEGSRPVRPRFSEDPINQIHQYLNEILMDESNPECESMDLASKTVLSDSLVGEVLHAISNMGKVALPQESSPSSPNVSGHGGLPSRPTPSGPSSSRAVPTTQAALVDLNLGPPCDVKAPPSSEQNYVTVPPKTTSQASISTLPAAGFNECPFSGASLNSGTSPNLVNKHHHRRSCHSKKSDDSDFWTSLGMFHKGIRCDGCGVLPIAGPRFKSKVKEDYDLCSICFSRAGNERDYIRMDKPVSVHPLRKAREPFTHVQNSVSVRPVPVPVPVPLPPLNQGELQLKLGQHSLDSRFVRDVNVLDGTVMAPSTPFTKLWRMRNNGSMAWPRGTQLVWISGDMFSNSVSVDLQIPEQGVGVDSELNVAVDFVAPESPGRYLSYWRMASCSGAKFGQRVWVLIHVDASVKDSVVNVFHGLNLNASPDGPVTRGIDLAESTGHGRGSSTKNEEWNDVERGLLKELEEMGFKEIEINKEILRKNEYDLDQTLDALCGASDCDRILKELVEMGFRDDEMNKRLLEKSRGSIVRAVMDLLSGGKA